MQLAPRIVANPKVRFGKPVIEGTRVSVDLVVGQLGAGMSPDEVAREYGITYEDVLAALRYAAASLASEEIRAIS